MKINGINYTDKEIDSRRIANGDYDRRRKMTSQMVDTAKMLLDMGYTRKAVASFLGVATSTVRYNTDEEFRNYKIESSGAHTGVNHVTRANRIAYKAKLIKEGKI